MEPDVGMVSERGSDSRWSLQRLTSEIRTVELTLNIIFIVTLKSGLQITQYHETGAIRKLGCGFLVAF